MPDSSQNLTITKKIKATAWTVLPMLIIGLFVWDSISSHTNELRLLNRHRKAYGIVTAAKETADVNDMRQVGYDYEVDYIFFLADGSEMNGSYLSDGRLPKTLQENSPIEVEYFPDDPTISKIKGFGYANVEEWLKHTWLLGIVTFAYFAGIVFSVKHLLKIWNY